MPDTELRHVMMPYTGRPFQDRMLGYVCDLVRAHRARLTVVLIRLVDLDKPLPPAPTLGQVREDPQAEHVQQICRHKGLRNVAVEVRFGRAFAPLVVQEVVTSGADMLALVVPRPEAVDTSLRQELDYILAKTPCQLLVLRPGLGPV